MQSTPPSPASTWSPRTRGCSSTPRAPRRRSALRQQLPGVTVHPPHRVPGVVHEPLLARTVLLAHPHVEPRRPRPVLLAEPTVLQPLGMGRLVLLPQQRQRHALAAQLAVHLTPPRHRTPPRARRREQSPLQPRIIHRVRQRPTHPPRLGTADALPHPRFRGDRRRHLQAPGDRPSTHPRGVVQPQDLSNLTHGQPPVRHRRTLLQILEGSYGDRLSRVAQLQGSDPLHQCGASRKSDHPPTGITDHFGPEYADRPFFLTCTPPPPPPYTRFDNSSPCGAQSAEVRANEDQCQEEAYPRGVERWLPR